MIVIMIIIVIMIVIIAALTLTLDKDDDGSVRGITDDADFLENVNMTDRDRLLENEKRAKRLKQPVSIVKWV
jgi:hypothetical protein